MRTTMRRSKRIIGLCAALGLAAVLPAGLSGCPSRGAGGPVPIGAFGPAPAASEEDAASGAFGPAPPGTTEVALESVSGRARFPLLVPREAPVGQPSRAQLTWLPSLNGFPARQAAAVWYGHGGRGHTLVIQAASMPGATPHASLSRLVGEGYFFKSLPTNSRLRYGSARGVDYVIISDVLMEGEMGAVEGLLEAQP